VTATRRLAAIVAADVAGYSRLMGTDKEGTLERLKALRRELLDPKIAAHWGRIVKTTGDGRSLPASPMRWAARRGAAGDARAEHQRRGGQPERDAFRLDRRLRRYRHDHSHVVTAHHQGNP
jgi:adenylate cyclase